MAGKLVMCTHGPEDPERATIPFVMATAAQAADVEVIIGLQVDGVRLAAPSFPALKDLFKAYFEAGGKLLVCGPCVESRKIDPKKDFVDAATVVGAATFVQNCTEATNVLVY